jgi:aldose 1-epimerase
MRTGIALQSGSLRCAIAPDLGGAIVGLWLGDIPVLRSTSTEALASAREAASYPLVPFSNRIGHASLTWAGTRHRLVRNNGEEAHAIHGVGWQRPWTVLEAGADSARLSYRHLPDAAWPFAFDAAQAFKLNTDQLEMTLSITNRSEAAAPVGLGWHPFFIKRSRSRIAFEASRRWEMSAEKLPTHPLAANGLDADCALLDVDHCFEGWTGVLHLRDEELQMRVSASLQRLVVYTNPSRNFVAIEPVSHVNNALNLMASRGLSADSLGVRVLQAGESTSAQMSIQVARA